MSSLRSITFFFTRKLFSSKSTLTSLAALGFISFPMVAAATNSTKLCLMRHPNPVHQIEARPHPRQQGVAAKGVSLVVLKNPARRLIVPD